MTSVIMDMEKSMVSPVFFQRLALKRKQREAALNVAPTGGKLRNAKDQVRRSAQGLLGRFKGRKSTTDNGQSQPPSQGGRRRVAPAPRGPPNDDEEPDDEGEETARSSRGPAKPSFAQKNRLPASGDAPFQPGPARNLRFVSHIKTWGARFAGGCNRWSGSEIFHVFPTRLSAEIDSTCVQLSRHCFLG